MKLENIERTVLSCALHNFLRRNFKDSLMIPNHIESTENVVDREQILINIQSEHNRYAGK